MRVTTDLISDSDNSAIPGEIEFTWLSPRQISIHLKNPERTVTMHLSDLQRVVDLFEVD